MLTQETTTPNMASSTTSQQRPPIIFIFVAFLLLVSSSLSPALSLPTVSNQTFRPHQELHRLKRIKAYLRKINKPAVKTIQSPDGDVIDCVLSHLQPAFDHPHLKGQKPLEAPERPKGHDSIDEMTESFQLWTDSGESCPEGTIPIRRTTERDILRASSIRKFGRKLRRHDVRHDTMSTDHEHAVAFVNGDQYYGAKASINVWAPSVTDQYEFSLSQLWVISGSFGNDLNTIEAGWQVSPELYGDNYLRFFTYWTTDAYKTTGCYNLLCSGFVQTNNKIAIGAAISPRSSYNARQFDIGIMVWKDPKHGHWWLEFGSGLLVGYWPSFLFSHLRSHASMIQFGGEIVNTRSMGYHTSTQMGSGHFADEGFGKASYFRNLQVVDWDNSLIPLSNLHLLADHPNCYNIKAGRNNVWGNYFYYGGPGRNVRCP
uniref:Neprosin PEP catalytic domain-containing protein n=1 Tax=Davidia involucrata TaxID=16924 RepID=A0A5B6Z0C1_DAVIN